MSQRAYRCGCSARPMLTVSCSGSAVRGLLRACARATVVGHGLAGRRDGGRRAPGDVGAALAVTYYTTSCNTPSVAMQEPLCPMRASAGQRRSRSHLVIRKLSWTQRGSRGCAQDARARECRCGTCAGGVGSGLDSGGDRLAWSGVYIVVFSATIDRIYIVSVLRRAQDHDTTSTHCPLHRLVFLLISALVNLFDI